MEMKIDIRRCVYELLKRTPIIIIATMIFAGLGIAFAIVTSENSLYSANASVCSLVYGSFDESINSQDTLNALSSISESKRVAERAAIILGDSALDGDTIKDMTAVKAASDSSSILNVYAYSASPQQAVEVANAVAQAFVIEVKNITGNDNVQVLDEAANAKVFVDESTQQMKVILIFTVLGFMLVCFVIVMLTLFSSKVLSFDECLLDGELELIGLIPDSKKM